MTQSLVEKVEIAGQLVVRARIFYDLWWLSERNETRVKYIDTMRNYNEFFRFNSHSDLLAYVIYTDSLLKERKDTINLPNLCKELKKSGYVSESIYQEIMMKISNFNYLTLKIRELRNQLFAHRSAGLSYEVVFKKAAITPFQMAEVSDQSLEVINLLLPCVGRSIQFFNKQAALDAERILISLHDRV